MAEKTDVSFVVPTLNEEKRIEACLRSIKQQKFSGKFEIIVVDAKSKDKTVKIAGKYADKIITSHKGSIGLDRNEGAKAAKGRYLIFIDADTQLYENYLESAINYMNRGYCAVSFGFEFDKKTPDILLMQTLANQYYHAMHILPGFNLVIPKNIFFKIGGFRNTVLEDLDISQRLRRIGKTKYVLDTLTITSARKQEKMGVLESIRYYAELYISEREKLQKYAPNLKYRKQLRIR